MLFVYTASFGTRLHCHRLSPNSKPFSCLFEAMQLGAGRHRHLKKLATCYFMERGAESCDVIPLASGIGTSGHGRGKWGFYTSSFVHSGCVPLLSLSKYLYTSKTKFIVLPPEFVTLSKAGPDLSWNQYGYSLVFKTSSSEAWWHLRSSRPLSSHKYRKSYPFEINAPAEV
jgi:hypothetical protein